MPPVRRSEAAAAAAAVAALLAGCAATYVPPPGVAAVPLTVTRGQSPALLSHGASFVAFGDAQCRSRLGSLGVVNLVSPEGKTSRVPAGTPVFLRAHSEGQEFGGPLRWRCVNVARLELEPGYRYEVQQHFSQGRCSLSASRAAEDAASAAPRPWPLVVVPVAGACKPA